MDFALTDEQQALAELAGRIFGDNAEPNRLKATEQSPLGYDDQAWKALATAGALGAPLPEADGGIGGSLVEACLILEQQGKRTVQVPYLASVVSGAMPLARFGTPAQRERWLPALLRGNQLATAALSEPCAEPRTPETVATPNGAGFRLSGVKTGVPYAQHAAVLLVPASTPTGEIIVCLIDPAASGVTIAPQQTMAWEPQARVELRDVAVAADAVLGAGHGRTVLDWTIDRTITGLCALATGVCQGTLRLTADYASNRKQFDKPIAMFQAVGQRMADCFIDNEAVGLTMWQAATRLAEEMPSDQEIATAKFWAADGGSRIGHAGLHIHGGISIDVDYPVHRFFLWAKQIEFTLGAATPQLVRLGAALASA